MAKSTEYYEDEGMKLTIRLNIAKIRTFLGMDEETFLHYCNLSNYDKTALQRIEKGKSKCSKTMVDHIAMATGLLVRDICQLSPEDCVAKLRQQRSAPSLAVSEPVEQERAAEPVVEAENVSPAPVETAADPIPDLHISLKEFLVAVAKGTKYEGNEKELLSDILTDGSPNLVLSGSMMQEFIYTKSYDGTDPKQDLLDRILAFVHKLSLHEAEDVLRTGKLCAIMPNA